MPDSICEVINFANGEISYKQYYNRPEPIKVIHNPPTTTVFWDDGTKTVVKCQDMIEEVTTEIYCGGFPSDRKVIRNWTSTIGTEEYDPEKGLALAFFKKMYGNTGKYYEYFKKFC